MCSKLVVTIIFVLLMPLSLYAEKDIALVESMLGSLTVNNSKNMVIPGTHGVLRIFFEKSLGKIMPHSAIELTYNGISFTFKMQGKVLAITQDGKLVFAINDNKIYAKSVHDCKENLIIKLGDVEFIYGKMYVSTKHKNEVYEYNEIVYDKNTSSLKVYNNGHYVKTIETRK